jgi:hypothetical protein
MKTFLTCIFSALSVLVLASTNSIDPKVAISANGEVLQPQSNLKQIRDYLEMASFAATILIAVSALIALKQIRIASSQLKIASDDIKIRSRREAIALSAKHCEDFANDILLKLNAWRNEFGPKGIEIRSDWGLLNNCFDETSLKDPKPAQVWVQQVKSKNLGFTACKILNQCEAFAIYFATGAADEEVAFPVLGPLFCEYVKQFTPFLIDLRAHTDKSFTSGKYSNTVCLFAIWSDRIRLEELEVQSKKTDKEKSSLKNEKIKPIGC